MTKLNVTIETKSNLYIGGMPQGFEIGGIDMTTATRGKRPNDRPYIPASSFKGALKEVCKDFDPEDSNPSAGAIVAMFDKYYDVEEAVECKRSLLFPEERWLGIFGMPGYNRSPKLTFTDFELQKTDQGESYFSIDMKNSIVETIDGNDLISNPRTYKTARAGLTFTGNIFLNFGDNDAIVKKYLEEMSIKFEEGVYRIGNSKSRGYGWIAVSIS